MQDLNVPAPEGGWVTPDTTLIASDRDVFRRRARAMDYLDPATDQI